MGLLCHSPPRLKECGRTDGRNNVRAKGWRLVQPNMSSDNDTAIAFTKPLQVSLSVQDLNKIGPMHISSLTVEVWGLKFTRRIMGS